MSVLSTAILAGVAGTLAMDLLNRVAAATGLIAKIDIATIGRMAAGWARGRFRYAEPAAMRPVARELLLGYLAHYGIGIGLAIVYVLGWDRLVGGPASPGWAWVYGIATTAASWFLVFPSLGLGAFGRRSPDGIKATLSSLTNHLFFGAGMAFALALA